MPIPHRKNIRLEGFDYTTDGAYFVTLVTKNRDTLFGEIVNDEMVLSEFGKIVDFTWHDLPNHNSNIELGAFCIMPNHIHGIIHLFLPIIVGAGSAVFAPQRDSAVGKPAQFSGSIQITGAGYEPAPTKSNVPPKSLSEIMRQLKTFSAKRINTLRGTPGIPIWQRNFHDHIIRNDHEYALIERYIQDNPIKWAFDEENRAIPNF